MKVIVLNRKRLGITIIVIGLMLILFGLERKFDERLKFTALIHSNINSLTEYKGLDNKFTYKLPSEWNTNEQSFKGTDIIYHNEFNSKDSQINGFVQVWNLKEDLKSFLDKSKEVSMKQNVVKNYSIAPVKLNNHEGYLVIYSIANKQGIFYRANEYFIKDKDKLFRFSFFVKEENYKEDMPTIFKTIVNTFNYSEK